MAALWALLHPNVSREYRAHYIERSSSDWRVQRYSATPEEGIEFSRKEWPDFVEFSFGITPPDSFGRWTDTRMALQSGFKFNRNFEGSSCVVIDAKPSASMRLRRVAVAFGNQEKEISFGQEQATRRYLVDFELNQPADTFELRFPKALPAIGHGDTRQLGVGLSKIRFFPMACSEISVSD
jgi:hypothetical protein